jgi:ATP:ADP antiporter, AAA family
MKNLIEVLFKVRPGEYTRVALLFLLYLAIISTGFVVGRTVASTLFLHRLDKSLLPYTYAALAIAVSLASAFYARISGKMRRDRMFLYTCLLFFLGLVSFRGLLYVFPTSLIVVGSLYVFIDVLSILCITQFWTLAIEVFDTREAKRVFGFIGGGSAIAMLSFGALVRGIVPAIGTVNLIYLMAGEMIGCMVLLWLIGEYYGNRIQVASEEKPRRQDKKNHGTGLFADFNRLLRTRHLATVAAITAVMAVAITLIDYQWKMSARASYIGNEDALARYFSTYNLFVGLAATFVQFFLTGRILEKLGILVALMLLPVALAGASMAVLLASASTVVLWAATSAAGANALLRFTVQNTAVQLFFRPMPADFRPRAQALVEGVLKPVVTGFTGLFIALAALMLPLRDLSYVALLLLVIWIVLNLKAKKQYVNALADRIRSRRLDLDGSNLAADEDTARVIRQTLSSGNKSAILSAMDVIRSIPERDWSTEFAGLLSSDHASVRIAAIRYLAEQRAREHIETVQNLLTDPDATVRSTTIYALGLLLHGTSKPVVEPMLKDPEPEVSGAAACTLMNHYPLEDVAEAAHHLEQLVSSDNAAYRKAAAVAIGLAELANVGPLLERLLRDSEQTVQAASLKASGQVQAPELLPALIALLADPRCARVATDSLVAYGATAIGELTRVLQDSNASLLLRARIPRVMAETGEPVCLQLMLDSFDTAELSQRAGISVAASRLSRRLGNPEVDKNQIMGQCLREVREFYNLVIIIHDINASPDSLIHHALEQKMLYCRQSIINLLALVHGSANFEAVIQGLNSSQVTLRSDALELLDNSLDGPERPAIIMALDAPSLEAQVETAGRFWPELNHASAEDRLAEMANGPDVWLAASSLQYAGNNRFTSLEHDIRDALSSRNPFLAQTALGSIRHFMEPEAYRNLLSGMASDPRPLVADYANKRYEGAPMLTIIEKVLFLKSVALFKQIPGPVLSRVAEIAQENLYDEGSVVLEQGTPGRGLFVVMRGKARVEIDGYPVATLGEKEFFGEMSLFDAEPASGSIIAQEELDLLRVEPQDFSDLMEERVEIAHGLLSVLIRRLRNMSQATSEMKRSEVLD